MRIALLCATRRGFLVLEKLFRLAPDAEIIVFSFREEPWEPPFLDDIRQMAMAKDAQFFETKQVGSRRWIPFWESTEIDLVLVASWRYMIPPSVYQRPRLGTFVFHDSLLPKYRGFAPTVWAMINGEDHTGVTLFEIAEEVDAGDIVDQQSVSIGPEDPIAAVMERVSQTYLDLLERNLHRLLEGSAPRSPQDHTLATFTCKRIPEDNQIDWSTSSQSIFNLIRASSSPYPGAFTYLADQKMYIWSAQMLPNFRPHVGRIPGRVIEVRPGEGSVVLTGDGAILLTRVQMEGAEIVCAANALASLSQTVGR